MAGRPLSNSLKKQMQKVVLKHSDMENEMKNEVMDIITGSIDKFSGPEGYNLEGASRLIKDSLDKQYGFNWHVAIGEGYAFDVTAQSGTLLYCYYVGNLAILCFKC
mmetsp:Transcript_59525/g.181716  ORF Transcript_59525/g.181716 Transcript_59525/m.181716 type:complete len:106 (-) Transcript_59525:194-511(-)